MLPQLWDMRENCLLSLPSSLGTLENLKTLILRDNLLSELPREIGQLKRLQRLDLCRNPLRSLPPELQQCESLEYLDISGTLIGHLPEWLEEMKQHKHLDRRPNKMPEVEWALARDTKHPHIPLPSIDNEPFTLWFERALVDDPYGPLKVTFRHALHQDLTDAEIASKARGMVGDEDWPEGWFVWGEDGQCAYIEYYLTSRWGDRHGRIRRDGSHEALPALWQTGPIDEDNYALKAQLQSKKLLD